MQKAATIAVINTEKKLLILQRGSTAPWMPNRYCLPGGKQESNESLLECAIRELAEETKICIINTELVTSRIIKYSSSFSKTIFLLNQFIGQVNLNWEHSDYKWVDKEESKQYKTVPGLKVIVENLHNGDLIC